MVKKKILITGASGFLGSHLYRAFSKNNIVFGTYNTRPGPGELTKLNLKDKGEILKVLKDLKPDCVIHNAAVSNPDYAEENKEIARKVNIESTEVIAEWCHREKVKLCFISTDQVFDGESSFYTESDPVAPVNYYGFTKAEAEKIVLKEPANAVFRMALMYGKNASGPEYRPGWVWTTIAEGKRIKVFVDQYRSILCVNNASELIKKAVELDFCGIMHLGGPERLSRYEMAKIIFSYRGIPISALEPVRHGEINLIAPRPRDVSLDISKARTILKIPIYSIREALQKYFS